jgi:hypothetical protein
MIPLVVFFLDEFGPLNLQPHPGRQWAARGSRRRATYKRPHGVRHLLAAYDLKRDRLYGHIKLRSSFRLLLPRLANRLRF